MTAHPSTEPSTKICRYCGKEFVPVTSWQKCCPPTEKEADSCAYKLRKQRFKAWIAENPEQYAASKRKYNDRVRKKRRPYQREYARKRRAADPGAHNKYIRDRRHANPVHHAKVRADWNAKNPKKLKMYRKRGYKKNAEVIKARSRDYTARRAAKLAEAKRVLAQREPDPRITLAVCLERQDFKGYSIANPLFFDVVRSKASEQRKARQDRRKKLYKRNAEELARERQRLASVPDIDLPTIAEQARANITQPPEAK